jgi:peptidoglycan/xylan/chitin deacetylase (PgdA/CDA1 family)
LGARLEGRDGRKDPVAAITFDDGYRDFYDQALPVLKKKGVPAAVFVVTDLVGTKSVQVHDKIYLLLGSRFTTDRDAPARYRATRRLLETLPQAEIKKVIQTLESELPVPEDTYRPFYSLTWEMLQDIRRAGITVGSHTQTHVLMTNESRERIKEEVAESRLRIERKLGTAVRHFAYPSGQFNTTTVDAVAGAGYRFAYTTCTHRDAVFPLLTVPRTLLWENSCQDSRGMFSESMMSCQSHRAFDLVSGCRQRHRASQENGYDRL